MNIDEDKSNFIIRSLFEVAEQEIIWEIPAEEFCKHS